MKVTIKDVARDAGVSPSTVSRVISNNSRIGEETRSRVKESIDKLGYTPNALARSLVNKRSRIIGVIMPHEADSLFSNPFFIQAMKGISISAEQNDYHIMYAFGKDEKSELDSVKNFVGSNIVDGVCLLTTRKNDKCIDYLSERKFPFVVIGRPKAELIKTSLWVDNDNEAAMRNIVRNLYGKGHRDIGLIGAKKNWTVSINRETGFVEECLDKDINFVVSYENDFTRKSGYRGAEVLVSEKPVTAIVATDDILAFGVQKYLIEKNRLDVEVVGFNNIDPSGTFGPIFSSVDINSVRLGSEAITLLISSFERKDIINHKIVDAFLVESK